ncbi:RNA-directed DNA polymerase (reverse transcriptase)-related family protein [Rhynchospora pubera]|uniref:RNA-directed DNA polymerase (Reverse transcriptase)-related family protein n=1 Tax=Rhynchospora pubera TaxID=906938 RepID=A0AAV8DYM2_9POAL|nr:RNA-directed DNA polymerase (reverse transcriptase)-related family protein [Rhynchospora pubera]
MVLLFQRAFLLKADINKAFDKLDWAFLQKALQYINMPPKLIALIITAYREARITISINGKGDGFLRPTQGLRQGCPMSPYIFIISMEILSRLLQQELHVGRLEGVRVARTSPSLTHAIYADDLVIMGDTRPEEIHILSGILHNFAIASGLHINPQKSKLWFSRGCPQEIITQVQTDWGADRVQGEERYLGIMLDEKGDSKRTAIRLLDKLRAKLSGWKSHMLSHAGRLVLIKSVLMSIPVYAMSFQMLPKGVIQEMNKLLAKFFWGKVGQDRYMSFIAWRKVCQPSERGGLGIKDLQCFGESLFMKIVWSLMAEEDKLWVKLCKAKYYPTVGYWRAKNNGGCSKMWGQVIKMKHLFQDQVFWQLGDGEKVTALSQPWFPSWTVQAHATPTERIRKVSSLLQQNTGQWDLNELQHFFQPHQIQEITSLINRPDTQKRKSDRLIWSRTKSGNYSVKEGYKWLTKGDEEHMNETGFDWNLIWKWKNLSPKLKVFLWRLVLKGLPTAANMHTRMQNFDPICQRCLQENEYEMHCLFFCNTSRQVWFGGQLGLRVHDLSLNVSAMLQQVLPNLDENGVKIFAHTMWEIWKERNKAVIEHSVFQPTSVMRRINAGLAAQNQTLITTKRKPNVQQSEKYSFKEEGWQVVVDASWEVAGRAGGAYLVYCKGVLHSVGLTHFNVHDPFHAEAVALKEAMLYFYEEMEMSVNTVVQFFGDCLILVRAVEQGDTMVITSWRATETVEDLVKLLGDTNGKGELRHVKREAVYQAHCLANLARKNSIRFQGQPTTPLQQHGRLTRIIDEQFFQRVQDDPP